MKVRNPVIYGIAVLAVITLITCKNRNIKKEPNTEEVTADTSAKIQPQSRIEQVKTYEWQAVIEEYHKLYCEYTKLSRERAPREKLQSLREKLDTLKKQIDEYEEKIGEDKEQKQAFISSLEKAVNCP